MPRDETLALFAQGKEAWNAWAEVRLAEKAALEAAGTWRSIVTQAGSTRKLFVARLQWSTPRPASFFSCLMHGLS